MRVSCSFFKPSMVLSNLPPPLAFAWSTAFTMVSFKMLREESHKFLSGLRWESASFLFRLCVFFASLTNASSYLAFSAEEGAFFRSSRSSFTSLLEELLPDELLPEEVDEPLPAEGCRAAELLLLLLLEEELVEDDPELEVPAEVVGLALAGIVGLAASRYVVSFFAGSTGKGSIGGAGAEDAAPPPFWIPGGARDFSLVKEEEEDSPEVPVVIDAVLGPKIFVACCTSRYFPIRMTRKMEFPPSKRSFISFALFSWRRKIPLFAWMSPRAPPCPRAGSPAS